MKHLFFVCLVLISRFAPAQQSSPDRLKIDVHPGIELFTVIQVLADKYPQPNPSAYSREALEYFGKYKDHPAVKKVASFGNTYTDLVELGWCMSGFPEIVIHETAELSWYNHYGKENVLEYLRLARDFFQDTHFWDFYLKHRSRYTQWGDALKAKVDSAGLVSKLQRFYNYDSDVRWWVCIDPLNSWGSHAIMTKNLNPQFSAWVVYNTGFFKQNGDPAKDPFFEFTNFDNLVFHEGSHVYLNGLMKQYEKQIDALAYLFNKDDEGMKRNGISNWRYCFDENVVRSVTAALYFQHREALAYKKQLARELLADFRYVEKLTPFIVERYVRSGKYKTFAEFFPEILRFLAEEYPAAVSR